MKQKLILLVFVLIPFLFPFSVHADTHGYGQGSCSSSTSICYTGTTAGTVKPGAQCGNLSDWKYGSDMKNPPGVPNCWGGFCCDPATQPTPTPDPNVLKFAGKPPACDKLTSNKGCAQVATALGDIPTDASGLVKALFSILLSLSGGVAMLLIIGAGYQLMTSQGNPEKVKAARESLTSAIVGLIFVIFSVAILQIIGVQILQIPGFK